MNPFEKLGEILDITILMETQHKDILENMKKTPPEELNELKKLLKNTDKESYHNLKLIRKIYNF